MRLRRVFEDRHVPIAQDAAEAVHVRRMAIEMHGQEGARARRDRLRRPIDVDQARARLDIDQNRGGAYRLDGQGRRNKGVRGSDHLVPRTDPPGAQGQGQRVQAVADSDHVFCAAIGRERAFEALHLRAADEAA